MCANDPGVLTTQNEFPLFFLSTFALKRKFKIIFAGLFQIFWAKRKKRKKISKIRWHRTFFDHRKYWATVKTRWLQTSHMSLSSSWEYHAEMKRFIASGRRRKKSVPLKEKKSRFGSQHLINTERDRCRDKLPEVMVRGKQTVEMINQLRKLFHGFWF